MAFPIRILNIIYYFEYYILYIINIHFKGLLFHSLGPKTTIFCYIYFSKDLDDYEKLPEDKDGEDSDIYIDRYLYGVVRLV